MDHNEMQHRRALRLDQERILSTAIDWYRETQRLMKETNDPMTWDDLSDYERGLFRAVERYEARRKEKKNG